MIESLRASCRELLRVPSDSADVYARVSDKLLEHVYDQLEANPKTRELIGHNPFALMRESQRNHAAFMATVFRLNSPELLIRSVSWVYRAYHARGFAFNYFPAELVAWQIAIHDCFAKTEQKAEILAVYAWLVQYHDDLVKLSRSGEGLSFSIRDEADEMAHVLLALLLNGDSQGCIKLAEQSVHTVEDLKHFYLEIIWPAMCKIGRLWEFNRISVAEEHLASAIVGRVMATLYPRFAQFAVTRGLALVTAGPNEFHEIGARMVADFMELGGWDVTYLGANTPVRELHGILKRHKPFVVALSVATVFNLDTARQAIQMIKEDQETRAIRVLVGGLAFNDVPQLWKDIGADGYAADAEKAARISDEWWQSRSN